MFIKTCLGDEGEGSDEIAIYPIGNRVCIEINLEKILMSIEEVRLFVDNLYRATNVAERYEIESRDRVRVAPAI